MALWGNTIDSVDIEFLLLREFWFIAGPARRESYVRTGKLVAGRERDSSVRKRGKSFGTLPSLTCGLREVEPVAASKSSGAGDAILRV
jgi:hypothetical protein